MAKITLTEPGGPYHCELDTDVMEVEIRETYIGMRFVTDEGAILSVCMRDSGFEVHYHGQNNDGWKFDSGWVYFKDGWILRKGGGEVASDETGALENS